MALHECGQPAAVGRVDFVQIYHHVKFATVDEPGDDLQEICGPISEQGDMSSWSATAAATRLPITP